MGLFFCDRKRSEPADNPHPTPIEILINTIADYVSPRAREERRQKQVGNPAEREIAHQRIEREAAAYRRGFPVAGHNEPQSLNQPSVRHRQRF